MVVEILDLRLLIYDLVKLLIIKHLHQKTMDALLVYPENKKQLKAIKSVMVALNVRFEKKEESPYDPEFVAKIERGKKDFEEGRYTTITLDEIWK